MNEKKANAALESGLLDDLERLPDDKLRAVADKARGILAAREKKQREDAVREIQKLAKAHGLSVAVKDPARKPGRPRKAKEGA